MPASAKSLTKLLRRKNYDRVEETSYRPRFLRRTFFSYPNRKKVPLEMSLQLLFLLLFILPWLLSCQANIYPHFAKSFDLLEMSKRLDRKEKVKKLFLNLLLSYFHFFFYFQIRFLLFLFSQKSFLTEKFLRFALITFLQSLFRLCG